MKIKNPGRALLLLLAPILVLNACSGASTPSAAQLAYETRRQTFLTNTAAASDSFYTELVRLHEGYNLNETLITDHGHWDKFGNREDTADFRLPGLLSMLIRYGDTGQVSESFKTQAKSLLLGFKYWPDELGDYVYNYTGLDGGAFMYPSDGTTNTSESMDGMCYYSENHYILFSVGAYLAGQLYPVDTFTASGTLAGPTANGVSDNQTGTEKMAKFRPRIMRWLELRYKSGFSEWLSNVYYNEDMPALLAIIELSEDSEMVQKAKMVLDLMIADIAYNSFKGNFQSTHGRTYESKMSGSLDSTGQVANLIFGLNDHTDPGNMTAVMLATSTKYKVPAVLYEIANDVSRAEYINKQRMGIVLADAASWGLDINDPANYGMTFLTMEAYMDPLFANSFKWMQDNYFLWGNGQFDSFNVSQSHAIMDDPTLANGALAGLPVEQRLPALAAAVEPDLARNTRTEVNLYTYRTPDYMMSTAQDWRPGLGGDQSSISQASLGTDAVFFVNHPAKLAADGGTPRYWTGNGFNPRSIQVKNVNITLYNVSADTSQNLYMPDQPTFTHAFFPKGHYDTFEDNGDGWYFAQKGDAYIAVYTSAPTRTWVTNGDDSTRGNGQNYELKTEDAANKKYIWITELSSTSEYATLAAFKTAILAATLTVDAAALTVTYDSPSQGTLVMDNTTDPLTQNAVAVDVSDYDRYDNVYSTSGAVGSTLSTISFSHNGKSLNLNWNNQTRKASSYLNK